MYTTKGVKSAQRTRFLQEKRLQETAGRNLVRQARGRAFRARVAKLRSQFRKLLGVGKAKQIWTLRKDSFQNLGLFIFHS